jgi:hypothetical protein
MREAANAISAQCLEHKQTGSCSDGPSNNEIPEFTSGFWADILLFTVSSEDPMITPLPSPLRPKLQRKSGVGGGEEMFVERRFSSALERGSQHCSSNVNMGAYVACSSPWCPKGASMPQAHCPSYCETATQVRQANRVIGVDRSAVASSQVMRMASPGHVDRTWLRSRTEESNERLGSECMLINASSLLKDQMVP